MLIKYCKGRNLHGIYIFMQITFHKYLRKYNVEISFIKGLAVQ